MFNGEVIPSTYQLYIWLALPFAGTTLRVNAPSKKQRMTLAVAATVLSAGLVAFASRNWTAEKALQEARAAAEAGDVATFLQRRLTAEEAMFFVGTYHSDFSNLITDNVSRFRSFPSGASRNDLIQFGIDDSIAAIARSDKPMLAMFNRILLGDMRNDPKLEAWIDELKQFDPYWYQPHETAARFLIRRRSLKEALREAALARELAPYVQSTETVWRQLLAAN